MIGKVYCSTSTKNKVSIDKELRDLIKIEEDKHVIMLVGAADGLELHYQNVLAWGGTIKNLTIVDISKQTIKLLEQHHNAVLSHYDRPSFVVSDLNNLLESWDYGQIGVIDFDGTTGIKANYHLKTLIHGERLKADYLIFVASARKQDPGMIAFGEKLSFVTRRVYVSKEEQKNTRGCYHSSYTHNQLTLKSTHGILNDLVKGRGHSLVKTQAYNGVSPMVLSAIKLSKVDPKEYCEALYDCMCCGDLFSKEWDKASKDYNLAAVGCDFEQQLEHQNTEKIKDLFKCSRNLFGIYTPTDDWFLKHDCETFKVQYPERHRIAMCKNGVVVRPYSFTPIEETELIECYRKCLIESNGNVRSIKRMVEAYCKTFYRDYTIVRTKLSKLGLWVNLYRTVQKDLV